MIEPLLLQNVSRMSIWARAGNSQNRKCHSQFSFPSFTAATNTLLSAQIAQIWQIYNCVHFYRTQVHLGSDLWVRMSLTEWVRHLFENLTGVTLVDVDEDTNSIPTDNANRAIQGNNVAMQWGNLVAKFWTNRSCVNCPISNWCKWRLLVAKFAISASSSTWWPKFANNGWNIKWWQICLLTNGRWRHLVAKFATNASGAISLPKLVQVTESISGSNVPLAMQLWSALVLFRKSAVFDVLSAWYFCTNLTDTDRKVFILRHLVLQWKAVDSL